MRYLLIISLLMLTGCNCTECKVDPTDIHPPHTPPNVPELIHPN